MRPLPRPLPRRRVLALRRPPLHVVLVVALSLGTGLVVTDLISAAEAARARWGRATTVVVATDDLVAGQVVGPGDVALREAPADLAPSGALETPPVGETIRDGVSRGEILTRARVGGRGRSGVGALLDSGERAVGVARTGFDVPVQVGDLVDVLATFDPTVSDGDPTFPVARAATVVAVDDDAVTVAVTADEAISVTFALIHGTVTLTLVA